MRKITRAMQMVSAAKMRKAQDATLRSRTYSSLAWELILNLSASEEIKAALLKTHPKGKKMLVVVLSSNMGLVGSLNANLLATVHKVVADFMQASNVLTPAQEAWIGEETTDAETESLADERWNINQEKEKARQVRGVNFITYGKKGRDFMVRTAREVLADFEKHDRTISTQDIYPISNMVTDLYKKGDYQKVVIIYNHFVSTLVQKPTVKQLLPFAPSVTEVGQAEKDKQSPNYTPSEYLFEPDPQLVMKNLLPRIIESQIYQTILEAEASEQSARMVMMKNATEAAGDLISDLTLTYNKLRQNKITTELAEITAGKIALE